MNCLSFLRIMILQFIFIPCIMAQSYDWAKNAGGLFNDFSHDMAMDDNGNIYLIGDIEGVNIDFDPGPGTAYLSSAGGTDIFIAKYDSLGNFDWARSIGGVNDDVGARIVVDGSGNVFITGWFASVNVDFDPGPGTAILGTEGLTDIYFARFDTDGNYAWAYNIGSTFQEGGHDIAIDTSGFIYITGYFGGTNVDFDPGPGTSWLSSQGNSGDIFIAKYSVDAILQWVVKASGSQYEVGNAINTDPDGNVIITGGFMGTVDFDPAGTGISLSSEGGYDVFIAKYDASGTFAWAGRIGGTGNDIGSDVVAGSTGTVFITCNFHGTNIDFDPGPGTACLSSNGGYDIAFAAFDAAGNYLWANQAGSPTDDFGVKIVLDNQGNVYHTGYFSGSDVDFDPGAGTAYLSSAGLNDIYFARYDPDGNFTWAAGIGGVFTDFGNSMAVTSSGKVVVTGGFAGSNIDFDPGPGTMYLSSVGNEDLFFASYSQTSTGIEAPGSSSTEGLIIHTVFPNPVADQTVIGFTVPGCEQACLCLYNAEGMLIRNLLNENMAPGYHSVALTSGDLAPGIYILRLFSGAETQTIKIIRQ